MTKLTIEQLKNALTSHGVNVPSRARREVYVRLYYKYVLPHDQSKGEFSSDEEEILQNSTTGTKLSNISFQEGELIVSGLDIATLSDEELYNRLQEFGVTAGPIVDTTRRIYQKKLAILMGADVIDSPYIDEVDMEDEYSDTELEKSSKVSELQASEQQKRSPHKNVAMTANYTSSEVRRRIHPSDDIQFESPGDVHFDEDLHNVSPRRPLHTVTTSSRTTTTTRVTTESGSFQGQYRSSYSAKDASDVVPVQPSKARSCLRLFVKLFIFFIVVAALYFSYQNYYSESPLVGLEHLARQALEAFENQQKEEQSPPASQAPQQAAA